MVLLYNLVDIGDEGEPHLSELNERSPHLSDPWHETLVWFILEI